MIESSMVTLTNIDPRKNMRRFYSVQIVRTLFGEWSIMREWGRIGSPGRVAVESFATEAEARRAKQQTIRTRSRHGYRQVST
jgi:predicted DNA-binding WGR domain protein